MNKNIKGDIVKEYLGKYPNTPTLTLAKAVYKDNRTAFKNIENARTLIRYYRGQTGNHARKHCTDRRHYKEAGDISPFDDLPKGIPSLQEAKYFNIKAKKTLILADIHAPYHDREALKTALEYGVSQNCDNVLLLGDAWDCYQGSFFVKDPRKRNIQEELDTVNKIISLIKEQFSTVYYKLGNHEERLERYLKVKAPELLDLNVLNYNQLIKGVDEFIRKGTIIKIGRLNLVHGHEFGRSVFNPVNAARGVFLRGHESCLIGHYHQSSNHTERTMNDDIISCWSVGCLCDLRPEYKPINIKWGHGVATVELLDGNNYRVDNRKIIKGMVY